MRLAGAVDIGGTGTKIGIVGEDGSIVTRATIPTDPGAEPAALVERIAATLEPMFDAIRADGKALAGVGVAVAGFLDRKHSLMYGNANLAALCGFPLRRAIGERAGMDCRLEVDSNAAVVADQRHGAARGATRALGITLGTGVGGGVIVNGQLLRFTGECAGDVGHIIIEPDGRSCVCGARGCMEALVSAAALSERGGGRPVSAIVASARAGDVAAREALGETGRWLGRGLAALVPLFAPERIVIGGGLSAAGELLLQPTRASFAAHASPGFANGVTIAGSAFEGWAGVVGAGSLVLDPGEESLA